MSKPISIQEYNTLPKSMTGKRRTERTGMNSLMSVEQFNASGYGLEDNLQKACVSWFKLQYPKLMIRGSMNGANLKGGGKEWNNFVRNGVMDGESDLHIIVPSGEFHSLFVELKRQKGKQRTSQMKFEQEALEKGHGYALARSLNEFQRVVQMYLETGNY